MDPEVKKALNTALEALAEFSALQGEDEFENFTCKGLLFKRTCLACPEQYDVLDGQGRVVGYVRLRWGHLNGYFIPAGGIFGDREEVYNFFFEDGWAGIFPDQQERETHLTKIATLIKRELVKERKQNRC